MSAVKTLASVAGAWIGLGLLTPMPARADAISRSEAQRLWTMVWSAGAINTYQAAAAPPAPAPVSVPAPAPISVPAPAPAPISAPVSPIFAASGDPMIAMPATPAPPAVETPVMPAIAAQAAPLMTAPMPSPAPMPAPTPMPTPAPSAAPSTAPATVNAFINMTAGPYPSASGLTTGTAQPWYDSPAAIQAFGGVPNAQQQSSFVQTVLQDVQHTYQLAGMDPTLTTDPNTPALHTISVVSGLSYAPNPSAIGITDVGGNGFSFIDKLDYANNPTDLAWAIAHNVSHELMHAFGIGYHPDAGNYVDAASATWQTLTDPTTTFGPNATQLLLSSQYGTLGGGPAGGIGAEVLNPSGEAVDGDETVTPEPATAAIWALGALGGVLLYRRRGSRASA